MTRQAFVALVTCFNDDETINFAATRAQVRRQVEAGNNIMCAGTNGDFTALTYDEKVQLTEEVVEEVGGRARVIVNAGMPATFETVLLARAFERIGVDGIAVITPFFIACTQDGLIRHFSSVADAAVMGPARPCSFSAAPRRRARWVEVRERFSISSRCAGPHHSAWLTRPLFIIVRRPVMMLSSTVIPSNSAMFWKVRAIPRRATW